MLIWGYLQNRDAPVTASPEVEGNPHPLTSLLFTKHRKHHTLLALKAYYLDFRPEMMEVDYSRSNLTKIHS